MDEKIADTNIFIQIFRGDADLKNRIESLNAAVSSIVLLELLQGSKDKAELRRIEKYLARFTVFHFDETVSKKAIELVKTYSKSHGLMLADAIIAATCLEKDSELITFNVKDFKFIRGLKLFGVS
ncbi:MAG TPA: type II toxin-antitoxin system VapC family toxin [Pyrinomonadaceae bacterium]|nr:type II toxin-antitoxin system VapC family toxin [Pyrinomonadaceae bacterium]